MHFCPCLYRYSPAVFVFDRAGLNAVELIIELLRQLADLAVVDDEFFVLPVQLADR